MQEDADKPAQTDLDEAALGDTDLLVEASGAEDMPEAAAEAAPSENSVDPSEEASVAQQAPVATAAKGGRGLAFLALLLALLGAGGVGYLYYELIYQDPAAALREQGQSLEQSLASVSAGVDARLQKIEATTRDTLQTATDEQARQLAAYENSTIDRLAEALDAAPPSQSEWKLAEAEYLLRIANHRVLMEQDSDGALRLLTVADEIMQDLDDFALHRVRARLADEMVALKQVRRDDLQGVYLRLEAIKNRLATLPFKSPEYFTEQAPVAEEANVWTVLYGELEKFIRVRTLRSDETIKPLLAPDEERYLELNLRLGFEQAQLAALKRQQAVFETSLSTARDTLTSYMDIDDPAVRGILDEIDAVLNTDLARPLPDVSGSLQELKRILSGAPDVEEAAPADSADGGAT
ncbi:MAG: uroporphyrinogen-III C-methyltransferase [Pseudomonadota bacterium]